MIKVKERMVGSREIEIKNAEQVKEEEEEEEEEHVILRWEKFVAKMDMRVLLVEADDSTRHIITALLKKCSYKVDAVSDGLKAWEMLNRRSHNIDLILTEVEVPSISGFSLLTLVTEHEVCRNIPVIMMSAHDSVSTVYNCMLKGAVDFLVKPIRKNELNNLWQHVWRRQALSSGQEQTASDAQHTVEVAAEKDAIKNDSSGYYEACCNERNRECTENGSNSQSSSSLQESETKKACPEEKYTNTELKQRKSLSSDVIIQKDELEKGSEQELMRDEEAQGSASVPKTNSEVLILREDTAADSQREHANITTEAFVYDNNIVQDKSSREAIDLIGTFNTYPECSYRSLDSSHDLNKLDSSFLLELSLNLSHPRGSINQVVDDGRLVKQSEASAFSRYNGRTLQTIHKASDSICDQQRGYKTNSDKLTHRAHEYSSGNCCPTISRDNNTISPTSDRLGIQSPRPQQVIPVTGPVKCASFEHVCNVYANLAPHWFCTQSSQSPLQSPDSPANHERSIQVDKNCPVNSGIRNSQKILQYLIDQNGYSASALMEYNKSYELELSKDQVHFRSVSNQRGSGGSCDGISNRINSTNNGSNGTSYAFEHVKVAAENGNKANLIHDEKLNRSIQREAALAKFRMKRKERCFDKKVRYQSRSKLAVQRPRVKGQFVRQVQTEAIEVETDKHDS